MPRTMQRSRELEEQSELLINCFAVLTAVTVTTLLAVAEQAVVLLQHISHHIHH